jgi:hypothetical protein
VKTLLAGLLAVGVAGLEVSPDPRDEERSAWAWRRAVALPGLPGAPPGFAALPLPPELLAHASPDLRDLRLVAGDGSELPYVVEARRERQGLASWAGIPSDVRREAKLRSVYTVDLGEPRRFDRVLLTIPGTGFAKRVQVEASPDGVRFREVLPDAGVFDRPWTPPVHHTTLTLREAISARFVRLSLDDRRSRPLDVTGVSVALASHRPGEAWQQPAGLTPLPGRPGVSRYRVEAPVGLSFETLRLESDDVAFSRTVTLLESLERNGRAQERTLGSGVLYRLRLPDEGLAGEALTLRLEPAQGGPRILEVQDGDSPPLRRPRVEIGATLQRLLFPSGSPLVLYYGNAATRAPLYDLETLRERLAASGEFAPATLGAESANPLFRKPAPLPFAALRGAELDAARWRRTRPLAIGGPEDLYTLTLAAADLGTLRRDLGDLRIADEQGRQLPYILEPDATEARVDLSIEREASSGRASTTPTSRYRLAAAGEALAAALPLRALDLECDTAFFSRAVRVLAPSRRPREPERVLYSGTLVRGAGSTGPLRLALDGSALDSWLLEIEEGDNAPLAVKRVAGVVRVPRVVFKASAGRYRLLLGNPDAAPPRYDLAALRREVLSYSAVPVEAGAAKGDAGRGRTLWRRLGSAPPAVLLWGALGVAVVALLLLTARILRQPAA